MNIFFPTNNFDFLFYVADEVVKYGNPQYLESDSMTLEPVLQQLLISKEEEVKEGLEHYQKLKELKTVLDSQAILG